MNRVIDVKELQEYSVACHEAALKWWHDPKTGEWRERSYGQLGALLISELAEMMEGVRKDLMDEKLPHRKAEEVEAADAVIRMLDTVGRFQFETRFNSGPTKAREWSSLIKGEHFDKVDKIFALMRLGFFAYNAIQQWKDDPDPALGTAAANDCIVFVRQVEKYCNEEGLDLWSAVEEKMLYNRTRADHKVENRVKEGGKAF